MFFINEVCLCTMYSIEVVFKVQSLCCRVEWFVNLQTGIIENVKQLVKSNSVCRKKRTGKNFILFFMFLIKKNCLGYVFHTSVHFK